MSSDREAALRDLLTAIHNHLDVPRPAHRADDQAAYEHARARMQGVRIAARRLTEGVLDSTEIQSTGRLLAQVALPAPYTAALPAAQGEPLPPPAAEDGPFCADVQPGAGVPVHGCNASPGHGGAWHVAYGQRDAVCARWPAEPAPDNSPVDHGLNGCYAEYEEDGGSIYICMAAQGHTGCHMAYGSPDENGDREVCKSWPQASPCGDPTPAGAV
jgi:hypothetical protein